jgi:hypothetical protein
MFQVCSRVSRVFWPLGGILVQFTAVAHAKTFIGSRTAQTDRYFSGATLGSRLLHFGDGIAV